MNKKSVERNDDLTKLIIAGVFLIPVLSLLASVLPWQVIGEQPSARLLSQSANYRISAEILGEGGGLGSSGSYRVSDSLGDAIEPGESSSAGFRLFSGPIPALYPGDLSANSNTITEPADGVITVASAITVRGHTAAGASVLVSVGEDMYTTVADDNGDYVVPEVSLTSGPNTIHSQSIDIYGNIATASVTVTRTTYFQTGTLLSRVHDAGQSVTWETISWQADTPAGTGLVFRTRTGNTLTSDSQPDDTWSEWSEKYLTPGQAVSSPPGQYIQYEATFSTNDGLESPTLAEVIISYDITPTPMLSIAGYTIDDDTFNQSYGNNDGIANPGEFLEVHLSLTNTGSEAASNVVIYPTTTSPYVNPYGAYFYDDSLDFGDIAPGQTVTGDDFDFVLSSDTPDGTTITFDLEITDGTNTWTDKFDLLVAGSDTIPPAIDAADVGPERYVPLGNPANVVAFIREGGNLTSVTADIEGPDENVVGTVELYDDGNHNDGAAGNRWFGGSWTPTSELDYYIDLAAIDDHGNLGTADNAAGFTSKPFAKTADILYVLDPGGNSADWLRAYFTDALEALGYSYDLWNTFFRGPDIGTTLNQYITGVVIWAAPDGGGGSLGDTNVQSALQEFLDAGGNLFITGQDVGWALTDDGGVSNTLYNDYLHASYTQDDVDLYSLNGVPGDLIGDGLSLSITGGDGADNQDWPSEIDPITPAVTIFTYDSGATLSSQLVEEPTPDRNHRHKGRWFEWNSPERTGGHELPAGLQGVIGSGSGAIRVDTGTYKVVYFAFGYEAIADAAARQQVMGRILDWLVDCTYSISPTSQSFGAAGGANSMNVTAPSGCNWTAESNADWISITSGASGSGNGTVSYSVATNTSTSSRTGTLTIAGLPFTVMQAGIGDSQLYLDPSSTSVAVSQIFTVDLKADTGTETADTADAYIDFDPTYLEVVDESGALATTIELNTDVFNSATVNSVDNATGHISFSATKFGSSLTGTFTAATVRLKAKAEVTATSLTFVRSGARISDLYQSGEPLNASLTDGSVSIISRPVLNGRVALERRGSQGDDRWVTELFRVSGDTTTDGIRVYQAGTTNLLGTFSATTDADGRFSVELTDIEAGTYDIAVKGANTLSNKRFDISLPLDTEMDFDTLRVGDSNGDDRVNGADVSYMVPSFLLCNDDTGFRPYADTNKDGCINGADVSALVPNFLESGDDVGTMAVPSPAVQLASGASLALKPPTRSVQAGDIFTLDIIADTGTTTADTVDAYIDFDPTYLEVVNESGTPATIIEANSGLFDFVTFNAADNAAGQINFSATKLGTPLTGTFRAATIRFRAKAAIATTDVVFVRSGARISELYQSGEPLNSTLTNGTVRVVPCPDFVEPPGVDIGDVQFVAARWRQPATGQPYDCNGDGVVTVVDIMCVAKRWGDPCSNGVGP